MGAVYGLKLTATPISVIAVIGAIMLAGIVVNNGIVLVDRINQLRRRGGDLHAAVRQAERALPAHPDDHHHHGARPRAHGRGPGRGRELRSPLAVTVISGLLLSTC